MDWFKEWVLSSALTQGILAIMVVGGLIYMLISNMSVPADYIALVGIIIGFYFGSKYQAAAIQAVKKSLNIPTKPVAKPVEKNDQA